MLVSRAQRPVIELVEMLLSRAQRPVIELVEMLVSRAQRPVIELVEMLVSRAQRPVIDQPPGEHCVLHVNRRRAGGVMKHSVSAVVLVLALGSAACTGGDGTAKPATGNGSTTTSDSSAAGAGFTYVSLGDSWPEGAHCNGCRTFPQIHAEALEKTLGETVTLVDLAGQAQPYFDTPGGGGSAGLLKAIRTDEPFREKVATGDVIVIATGPNDGGDMFEQITGGTCGKDNTACVAPLARTWKREFDQILDEIEALRQGRPTAIRLVNAANAFNDPSSSAAARHGFEAYFDALTVALCDNAEAHEVVCVDVRPVLNGPGFEQPVDDSSQESMDAVAELLERTGAPELE